VDNQEDCDGSDEANNSNTANAQPSPVARPDSEHPLRGSKSDKASALPHTHSIAAIL
jgi:hypothetical protein